MWWIESLAKYLDNSTSKIWGFDPTIGLSYVFNMSFAQGEAIMRSFQEDWLVEIQWICDTLEEKLAQMDRGAVGMHLVKDNRTDNPLRPREWLEDPVPPYFKHQRLISAGTTSQRPLGEQPYRRDSSGGEGITVFVLDSGFDLTGYSVSITSQTPLWDTLMGFVGTRIGNGWQARGRLVIRCSTRNSVGSIPFP